ncbi:2654_t:CDS:2, partial [Entrophospora sp. SA101]
TIRSSTSSKSRSTTTQLWSANSTNSNPPPNSNLWTRTCEQLNNKLSLLMGQLGPEMFIASPQLSNSRPKLENGQQPQQIQNLDQVFFWPIQNTNQSFQPIQNPDQHHHLPQQQQNFNQDYDQPNLDQQQKSYARQIQQQRIQNYILQSYEHYNQNRNNRNHMITPTQVLSQQPQKQRQIPCVKENSSTPSPTIYNDCLNLNIPSSNIHYGINSNDGDDPLILRISDRLLLIKDYITKMNQQYVELEQDFIKLRRI